MVRRPLFHQVQFVLILFWKIISPLFNGRTGDDWLVYQTHGPMSYNCRVLPSVCQFLIVSIILISATVLFLKCL